MERSARSTWIFLRTFEWNATHLLLNILPLTAETQVSYVSPGAKARLIHCRSKSTGSLPFGLAVYIEDATDFTIHVQLGGTAGVVAPIIGKLPSDYHIWLQTGTPPV